MAIILPKNLLENFQSGIFDARVTPVSDFSNVAEHTSSGKSSSPAIGPLTKRPVTGKRPGQ